MKTMSATRFAVIRKCISDYIDIHGYSPALSDIVEATGIAQTTVYRYLNAMVERGELEMPSRRCISLTNVKPHGARLPVVGTVPCGSPLFAEENIEEYVRLPVSIFGQGDYFLLRANGNSMINAGIKTGDYVLVQKQNTAVAGQIVVALIEDEATLKRFFPEPEKHRVRLHPDNPEMEDIIVPRCEIQGVAIKVISNLV